MSDTGLSLNQANGGEYEQCVDLLLEAGAAVNHATKDGHTPLYVASFAGQENIVQRLLRAGAAPDQAARHRT